MPVIGITGGVASGKSTFRKLLLAELDADFFDVDACARDLLDSDDQIRREVIERVTTEAYSRTGEPNRPLLREIIYGDVAKKKTLEAILHPRIRDRWVSEARDATAHHRLFVVDIPLLFETRAESLFDHVIVVACSWTTQMDRLTRIRKLDQDLASKIIASQLNMSDKIKRASRVVWNGAAIDMLQLQASLLADTLRRKYD